MSPARPAAPLGPVLPDYGERCLTNLVPGFLAGPGDRPAWLPEPVADAAQVVLLVLDGLGWGQLQDRAALAPTLSAMTGGPITSVVPTTTATALTSIVVGRPPADHGVVGYRMRVPGPSGDEVLNVLRWRTVSGDARQFFPPREAQTVAPFAGRDVAVVSRGAFAGSGFSSAHLGDTRLAAWAVPSSIAVEVRRLLAAGDPLIYVYYDGVDKIAHLTGLGEHYDAELGAADALVAELAALLPPGAALAVTADHGQVEVGARLIRLHEEVLARTSLVSGEARFRWLHAKPGEAGPLEESAGAHYGHAAWVVSLEQTVAEGWFGGPLSDTVRRRLGDVAIVARDPVAYLEPEESGDRLVCRHGSLTADEMFVPLLATSG
ncbi:MAG: alkaline phosphatase family protein [Acidimicrobiales bacterium]